MTETEAKALGYEIIEASQFEWGLIRKGRGIRTWWKGNFEGMPTLEHPDVQLAIKITEDALGAPSNIIVVDFKAPL